MAGLTSAGFVPKVLADILAELNAAAVAALSTPANPLNISSASAIGQLNGIVAAQLADAWSALQAVYASEDPDAATQDALASLSLLTGTVKRAATYSIAKAVTVNVDPGTYAAGTLIASVVGTPTSRFASRTTVTNAGGAAANFTVDFQAQTAGPVVAPAGTLTVRAQPVAGWNSVTNATDAVVGLPVETDPQLRVRRIAEIQAGGSTDVDAIQAAILQNLGQAAGGDVIAATVLGNDTNATDANGLPPHSVECIVLGVTQDTTANAALAAQIYASKAAGDLATGTSSTTVTDSQGNAHAIGYTRPTTVPVYVSITVKTDPKTFPADGATQVKNAILAYGTALGNASGQSVIYARLEAAAFTVVGVTDVTVLTIGTAPSPTGTVNIPIALRQVATFNSANITVTVT